MRRILRIVVFAKSKLRACFFSMQFICNNLAKHFCNNFEKNIQSSGSQSITCASSFFKLFHQTTYIMSLRNTSVVLTLGDTLALLLLHFSRFDKKSLFNSRHFVIVIVILFVYTNNGLKEQSSHILLLKFFYTRQFENGIL